jgi:hypothetical protein
MVEGISMVGFTKQLIIWRYHLVVEVLHVFTTNVATIPEGNIIRPRNPCVNRRT